jgi:hypothetical protein
MKRSSMSKLAIKRTHRLARARSMWLDAARLASIRRDAFLRSETQTRAFVFAGYLAALDAAETAAAEIARLVPDTGQRTAG